MADEQAVGRGVGQLDRLLERVDLHERGDRAERLLGRRRARRPGRRRGSSPASRGRSGSRRPARRRRPRDAPRSTASATCSSILAATCSLLTGPIVVASSKGSPSRTCSVTRRASCSRYSSRTARCTRMPLARRAALPGAQVARGERGLDRGVDVGVVHDDHAGRCRPSPAARPCPPRPGRRAGPVVGRADEGHAVDAGVGGDLVADDRPRAGHEVEHAGREVGLGDAARQRDGAHGGRGRGRPHHRVAARQRRARSARRASCRASSTG